MSLEWHKAGHDEGECGGEMPCPWCEIAKLQAELEIYKWGSLEAALKENAKLRAENAKLQAESKRLRDANAEADKILADGVAKLQADHDRENRLRILSYEQNAKLQADNAKLREVVQITQELVDDYTIVDKRLKAALDAIKDSEQCT